MTNASTEPTSDLRDTALSVGRIRRTLVTDRVGFRIHVLDGVASTNTTARALADHYAADGEVVFAESQLVGRGRLGAPWFSPARLNLHASVVLRPAIAPAAVGVYTMIASLALTDAIAGTGLHAAIKWPNDVVIGRQKVGGALASYHATGRTVDYVILGVGVNLNVDRATLRTALGDAAGGATSLSECAGRPIDRNQFAAAFLNALERWDEAYRRQGAECVLAEWRKRDALRGQTVGIRDATGHYLARPVDVRDDGLLVVEDLSGAQHVIANAEIRFVA